MRLHLHGHFGLTLLWSALGDTALAYTFDYGAVQRDLGARQAEIQRDGWTMTLALEARAGAMDELQMHELPQCGVSCLDGILPRHGCQIDNSCFCSDGNLTASLDACVQSNCTTMDGLAVERFQAETCDKPVRNRGELTRRLCWAMFPIATLAVAGRFLSRTSQLGGSGFGWDDWTVLFCYVLLVVTNVSAEREVYFGLGMDMYMLSIDDVIAILGWFYLGEIFYNIIIMLTKVSLVLLYLRIWTKDSVSKAFRTICWTLVGLLCTTAVVGVLVIVFQCMPISYAWLRVTDNIDGECIRMTPFTYTYGALNICFDVVVFFLPIHSLLQLKIPWPKKFGICSIFLVGLIVTICSVTRLQYLVRLSNTQNISWDYQYIGMWSLVEANFSVVCCCMPAMAGLIQRRWHRRYETSASDGTSDSSSRRTSPNSPTTSSPTLPNDIEQAAVKGERGSIRKWTPRGSAHHSEYPSSTELISARDMLRRQRRNGTGPGTAVVCRRQSGDMPHIVEIAHEPPTETSTTRLSYRDHNDILHEVEITDRPQGKVMSPGKVRYPPRDYPGGRPSAGRPPRVPPSPSGPRTNPHTLLSMERPSRKRPRSQ